MAAHDYKFRRSGPPKSPWNWPLGSNPALLAAAEAPPEGLRVLMPDFARGYQRAANMAYSYTPKNAGSPDVAAADTLEIQRRMLPERWGRFFRAALPSHFLGLSPQIVDENLPRELALPHSAPGPRRTAADAYVVTISPQIPTEANVTDYLLPERAPGALRSVSASYLVAQPPPPPTEAKAGDNLLLPHAAPGYRRASADSYVVSISPQIPTDPLLTELQMIGLPPAGARRAGSGAYDVLVAPALVLAEDTEIVRVSLPSIAHGPARAANTAYWLENKLMVPDAEVPTFLPSLVQPMEARRSANTSYWRDNFPQVPDALPPGVGHIDLIPRPYRRSANTSYWLPNFTVPQELPAVPPPPPPPTKAQPIPCPATYELLVCPTMIAARSMPDILVIQARSDVAVPVVVPRTDPVVCPPVPSRKC